MVGLPRGARTQLSSGGSPYPLARMADEKREEKKKEKRWWEQQAIMVSLMTVRAPPRALGRENRR